MPILALEVPGTPIQLDVLVGGSEPLQLHFLRPLPVAFFQPRLQGLRRRWIITTRLRARIRILRRCSRTSATASPVGCLAGGSSPPLSDDPSKMGSVPRSMSRTRRRRLQRSWQTRVKPSSDESTSVLQKRKAHRAITHLRGISCACRGSEERFHKRDAFNGNYARVVPIRSSLTPPTNLKKPDVVYPPDRKPLSTPA